MIANYKKTFLIPHYDEMLIRSLFKNIDAYRKIKYVDEIEILITFPATLAEKFVGARQYISIKKISKTKMNRMERKALLYGDQSIKIISLLHDRGEHSDCLIGERGFTMDDLMLHGILGIPEAEVQSSEQI